MPKIFVLNHFYRPDDIVSAVVYSDLGEELAKGGWEVEAWPCNRNYHDLKVSYPTAVETMGGVKVRRVWRPSFGQHNLIGRFLSALWVEKTWAIRALFLRDKPDAVLIGSDPVFAVLLAPFLKFIWPRTKIVHWCFDLYPDFAVAEGLLSEKGLLVRVLRALLKRAYAACDLTVNIGSKMAKRLAEYPQKKQATLTPWAPQEPSGPMAIDQAERKILFEDFPLSRGPQAEGQALDVPGRGTEPAKSQSGPGPLALLYSGSLKRPHEFYLTLKLARKMLVLAGANPRAAQFAYSARGSRLAELRKAWNPEYVNVRFFDFAPLGKLAARLSAPDIHIVTLRSSFTGVAVPFKFFVALAIGRPVLFEGPDDSGIAGYIREFKVGWVLNGTNLDQVAKDLIRFSKSKKAKEEMFKRCHEVYQANFSKQVGIDNWVKELRSLWG